MILYPDTTRHSITLPRLTHSRALFAGVQLWLAGNDEPLPWNIVPEVCDKLRGLGVTIPNEAAAPAPSAAPAPEPQQSSVLSAVSSVVGSAMGAVVGATGGSSADERV